MARKQSRELGDQPAAPFSQITESYHQAHAQHRGATKRELAAMFALQGIRAGRQFQTPVESSEVAALAVADADALMAALVKEAH